MFQGGQTATESHGIFTKLKELQPKHLCHIQAFQQQMATTNKEDQSYQPAIRFGLENSE